MLEQLTQILDTVNTMIPLIFIGYLLLSGAIGLLRGWRKSVIRLITLAGSALLAYLVTTFLVETVGDLMQGTIEDLLTSLVAAFEEMQNEVHIVAQYVTDLSAALVGPVLFAILFTSISALTMIVYTVLKIVFVRKRPELFFRFIGIPVGVVCGLLCCVCVLTPVTGIVGTISAVVAELPEDFGDTFLPEDQEGPQPLASMEEEGEQPEDPEGDVKNGLNETIEQLKNMESFNGMLPFKVCGSLGSNAIYASLTKITAPDGSETDLTHELVSLVRLLPSFTDLTEQFGQEKDEETGMIDVDLTGIRDELIDKLTHSHYLGAIVAEVIHTAGNKWDNGEEFLGLNMREIANENNAFRVVVDTLLNEMKITKVETLDHNIAVICDNMTLLSHTASYVAMFSESDKTHQDLQNKMDELVLSVNQNNIDLLNNMMTKEVMEEGKLSEANATDAAALMKEVLTDVSQMENEEEKLKESKALNTIFSYAGLSDDENKQIEESAVVDAVLESSTVSKIVKENAQKGEEEFKILQLTGPKAQELTNILGEKEAVATEEEKETIEALRALFGLN